MVNPTKEIAYGAAAGCLGKFIEFPFDTVKVRLQSAHGTRSTISVISHILRQEGVLGFYKGLKAPLFGACLESAILFSAYEYAQQFLRQLTPWLSSSMLSICCSGVFSGFAASFVLTPVELVKCNLQVANLLEKTRHESYGSILSQIIKRHGIAGLWLGLSSTLLREMAGTAVWFAAYEKSAIWYNRLWPEQKNINSLMSGATAGFLFNLSIFPVDTIKSNIQTAHISGRLAADLSFSSVLRSLVRRPGGVANLYNGLGITLVRSIPANAVIFYTYEYLKTHF
ncbi:mitochondrial carrier [Metschnikowia bicuspidata var. bicuspidata NRRL YB-4993]|uniref:Mitochondrial carrier n=1 Tax=Metschnikowia bicuspidata var. bicuspidata NRRL YB-4993 TaxID=869754 RepID=A0A1A0H9D0_9ASCO|nr:mitochondrial carrier [Metschnikowia bicuspidata var. bicuspidata NRRL YB-4993]OBA20626.1 mitochondrial carrier [Metschnikowia bicuspidata var. bicuspidata NRRL YB-4993]